MSEESQENRLPRMAEEFAEARRTFQEMWDQTYFCACTQCGSDLRLYKSQAGKTIECPQCGKEFVPLPPPHGIALWRPPRAKHEARSKLRLEIEVELRFNINVDWPEEITLDTSGNIGAADASRVVEEARTAVAAQWGEEVAAMSLWVHVHNAETDTPIGRPLWYDPETDASLR